MKHYLHFFALPSGNGYSWGPGYNETANTPFTGTQ